MALVYGTYPLRADCCPEHISRRTGTHVANFTTEPGFCIGESFLKPTSRHVPIPLLCVPPEAVEGTLEEIDRRRAALPHPV